MAAPVQVFISYRREDSREQALLLYQQIAERLPSKLFMDIESIAPGEHFEKALETALTSCDVLLALIGKRWKGDRPDGGFRIDQPNDFVRREIEAALRRKIPVIPVLLENTAMPGPADLPAHLSDLTYRQGLPMRKETIWSDLTSLIQAIDSVARTQQLDAPHVQSADLAQEVADAQRSEKDRTEREAVQRLRAAGVEPQLVIQEGHFNSVTSIAFHPAGRWIASGSSDRTVRIWEIATGKIVHIITGHEGDVRALAFSPDGRLLASGGRECPIRLWDTTTGEWLSGLEGRFGANVLAFSPAGDAILAADPDIRLFESKAGREIQKLDEGWYACFSPDGAQIASPFFDGVLRIWDRATGPFDADNSGCPATLQPYPFLLIRSGWENSSHGLQYIATALGRGGRKMSSGR
jgi:WD40 repeat protein